ncbi:thiamine pyridinylase [Alkalicaulis satelles]|uniref:Thiamine pyridinylase n=1 Tax=Alkalicaulis satelles TaxID=2609175 RepID=A0A5M6ZKB4_9PROT|nr:thiamine pyridinylase [Alkalicaulis satelles]KAA5804780.1 thiamine pyridinylase [Alkalicaulis satelles]
MNTFRIRMSALAACISLFAGPAAAQNCDSVCVEGETCIAAALYPYVPDTTAFASAICSAWSQAGYTEKLYLIADESVWDGGYSSDPVYTNGSGAQTPIDVFVYDAMYLNYWAQQTVPVPADQISDPGDFVEYARTALVRSDGSMTALPVLGCTNIMFYLQGDSGMEGVSTLAQFFDVNPAGVYISPVPFGRSGAMLDMSGSTTIGVDYMVRGYLQNGAWPDMGPLDGAIITPLARLSESASYYNALTGAIPSLPDVEDQYVRAGYFSQGYGRTSIGFSESMSQMSDDTRSRVRLSAFPWSDHADANNLFYADVAGVNAQSSFLADGGDLPFRLANLMTREAVLQDSIAPPGGPLSYLFPARVSVLNSLAQQDPLYAQMAGVLNSKPAELVAMPTSDRDAFHAFGGTVRSAVKQAFQGHCDLESPQFINSNTQAQTICPQVCADSGGWIGSWTNVAPPAWPQYSACGCAVCTADSPLPPAADGTGMRAFSPMRASIAPTDGVRRYQRN